ncbi:helix-turn-helix transcriptional regulator [Providencia rettgeri]|uniref:helix-turn-helix domain-containing protein n=1 Tax=Providencia TaxID=586 RepID=UPI001B380CA0|nr:MULTISPECIES: helix-turn-helix transcriptional regulator [Providencia]MBQ0210947.1 helix-turn-helix transcriptional regulator [Providencia rettgeri]MDR9616550.1 helix-turn-helix transcriptional regulator [Providencia rettgeri]
MSIDYAKKLLLIRKSEKLTQQEFADLTGISLSTIKKYETGHQPAGASTMESVIQAEKFKKYAMWLTINETFESAGQISPSLSPDGQENKTSSQSERKIG